MLTFHLPPVLACGVRIPFLEEHNLLLKVPQKDKKERSCQTKELYAISVTYGPKTKGRISLLIYEWKDFNYLGSSDEEGEPINYICTKSAVAKKQCKSSQLGQFITRIPANERNTTSIYTDTLTMKGNDTDASLYKVERTGYYCVALNGVSESDETVSSGRFEAWVEWKAPYGELPSADYPKLLLYGAFAIVYLAVGLFWFVQTFRYWSDILPVQHFLSGAIFYLVVEMAFNFGYWEAYNQTGKASYGLLALVALLNAGRTSMSFFMLLIVCMGYSVVNVVYTLGTMLLSPETAGFLILLVIFPLSITMTVFYVWTLNSITATIQDLELRKQHVKILMYKRLYRLLVFSVVAVVLIFILNMMAYSDSANLDWAAKSWKYRWVMLDGLLNILYFVVIVVIVVLWRPTNNNARYGLMQISQDEEEALDLEERLRREEEGEENYGRRGGERHVVDESAIFELGEELTDEEDNREINKVELSDISKKNHRQKDGKEEQSALLHVEQDDDEEDDHLDDSEHARLTKNARRLA
ncbi:lung seven transmembrane receptor-domain-containing protein [Sporodiniella umbellata]|nr:lung seven transmembrane receptor-domain-containing protein [Sporodiniella umbellata]